MAKILIEIDGRDASVKVDGKEIENLSSFYASFYSDDCRCDGTVENYVAFDYSVKDKDNGEFPSVTRYCYEPSKASFEEGKKMVDTKHPTIGDYGRM
jgi:hypothetical protein